MSGTVLITGGAGDIGLGCGRALARAGMKVVLADVSADRLETAVEALSTSGGNASQRTVDLSLASACIGLVEEVWENEGPITALVNAAAVTQRALIHELTEDAWDRLVAVNLSSVFWTCRTVIGLMLGESRPGVIVNLASIAGVRPISGSPAYSATKGGVISLSRALALDHARDGIRVHAVAPPAVDTQLFRAMFSGDEDPQATRAAFEAEQGAGRVLTVDEISSLVEHLVSGSGPIYSPEPLVW